MVGSEMAYIDCAGLSASPRFPLLECDYTRPGPLAMLERPHSRDGSGCFRELAYGVRALAPSRCLSSRLEPSTVLVHGQRVVSGLRVVRPIDPAASVTVDTRDLRTPAVPGGWLGASRGDDELTEATDPGTLSASCFYAQPVRRAFRFDGSLPYPPGRSRAIQSRCCARRGSEPLATCVRR